MSETQSIDPVQAQYERWVYPPKEYDLAILPLADPGWHYDDLRKLSPLFWPRAPYRDDLFKALSSSALRRTLAAAMFSSKWLTDDVPGMGRTLGDRARSQARSRRSDRVTGAARVGVAPLSRGESRPQTISPEKQSSSRKLG